MWPRDPRAGYLCRVSPLKAIFYDHANAMFCSRSILTCSPLKYAFRLFKEASHYLDIENDRPLCSQP